MEALKQVATRLQAFEQMYYEVARMLVDHGDKTLLYKWDKLRDKVDKTL